MAPECEFSHGMVPEFLSKNGLINHKLVLGPFVKSILRGLKEEEKDIHTGDVPHHCSCQILNESGITPFSVCKALSVWNKNL